MLLDAVPIPRRLALIFGVVALLALAAGGVSVATSLVLARTGVEVGAGLAPLGGAAVAIKYTATRAHLVFEEIVAGDATESVDEVRALLAETRFYADAIRDGGTNAAGVFVASTDPAVRDRVAAVGAALDDFTAAVEARAGILGTAEAEAGSSLEQAFDDSYDRLMAEADGAAALIHADMGAGLARLSAAGSLAAALPVAGIAALLLVLLCAWRLLARGVSARIVELAGLTRALAAGDLGAPAPAWTAGDELGGLAESLEAFRAALVARTRLAAERAAAEEAEASRAAAARALTAALADLADRVAAGDLSARLPAQPGDPALDRLAQGANRLAGTVESVVTETARVLRAFAAADLTQRMAGGFEGAFGELRAHADDTAARLGATLGAVRDLTDELGGGTAALAQGSAALAARAETQAANLEQISATMEDMAGRIGAAAARAGAADAQATAAAARAAEGQAVVARSLQAMRGIEESAEKITAIIAVIDGIAFQTNLLALNAAVEAARAGDAGKGFAVVAAEVRGLAQRASSAARDIAGLIRESGTRVTEGVELAAATGEALDGLRQAVGTLGGAISGIAVETREVAASVAEVKSAVQALDTITQANATLADESAATTRTLSTRMAALTATTAAFRLPRVGDPGVEGWATHAA